MSSALRNFIVTFLVAAILFGVAAYLIISGVTGAFNSGGNSNQPTKESESETSDEPAPAVVDDGFSVLLIGTDYQPYVFNDYDVTQLNKYKDGFPFRPRTIQADSITIMRADRIDKRFVFISILANLVVNVAGIETQLRDVIGNNNIDYFVDTVYGITGIKCDFYAMISITNMQYVIDAMGGIDFNVPIDMYYRDPTGGLANDII